MPPNRAMTESSAQRAKRSILQFKVGPSGVVRPVTSTQSCGRLTVCRRVAVYVDNATDT